MKDWYFVVGYKEKFWIFPKWPEIQAVCLRKHYDLILGNIFIRIIKR
jgi:hypothetical protein